MSARRVIFRSRKGAAPAAVPAKPVSVRMLAAPVMFVKSVTPAPVPEPDPDFDFGKPMTGHMFDLVCKALHAGEITPRDAARANDAYLCGRPLPHGLIETVLAKSR